MAVAPVVTERWSARKFVNGISAERGWDVTGLNLDEQAAWGAIGAPAILGATHPLDGRLWIIKSPEVTRTGPASFFVRAQYAVPKSGTFNPPNVQPLDLPIVWKWTPGVISEPTDVDADNLVIINAAGFPISGQTADIPYFILTATRNEHRYDVAKGIAYQGTYNTDSFTIPLTPGAVEPGQALFISYQPTAGYTVDSQYVPVEYVMWLRRGHVKDSDGIWDSWKYRLRNQGKTGWYDSSGGTLKPGAFVGPDKKRPDEPVLLDENGKPLNTQWKVGDSLSTPANYTPKLIDRLIEKTTGAVYLKNRKHLGMPFSGLSLF